MKIKRILCAALSSVMIFSSVCAVNASADWEKTAAGTKYWSAAKKTYATGWWVIGGEDYYFNSDGIMQTGWFTDSNGRTYYFNTSSGKMRTGWLRTSSGNSYYFDATGIMHTGWLEDSGDYYYFRKNGKMIKDSTVKINNVSYTFDENGKWDGNGTAPSVKSSASEKDDESGSSSISQQYKEMCTLRDEAYANIQVYQEVYDEAVAEKQKLIDKMEENIAKADKIKAKYEKSGKGMSATDNELVRKYMKEADKYRAEAAKYNKTISDASKKKNEWSKLYKEYKKKAEDLKKQLSNK
ncbi:MAG: hypothetical protein MRZ61_11610 [Oscillospiraceae bacterium]|nr:hypothetical protein [Oscillospiraceae bacterium]